MRSNPSPAAGIPVEIRLPEEDAQAVLLVRAVEEEDPGGGLLPLAERGRATDAARSEVDFESFLRRRARDLSARIDQGGGALSRVRRVSRLRLAPLWVIGPALALGLASNLLGPEKQINVVANPLAGLILWNVAIYVFLLLALFRRRSFDTSSGVGAQLATSLVEWRANALRSRDGEGTRAAAAYLERWRACAAGLLGARVRYALHLGAAALVLGALGGMYARGLLFEYQATWESTFLGADDLQAFLGVLLGPAAALSGIAVPDVAPIQAKPANAGDWIHLFAVTTVWLVLVPRILLASLAARHARRLAANLILDTRPRYYRRVYATGHGGDLEVVVQPYSYTLTPGRTDALKTVLHDVLGARAHIGVAVSVDYGAGLAREAADAGPADRATVLVFNLAQTPETEVHGRMLQELKNASQDGSSCLVLVDSAAWTERSAEATFSERRRDERRRTWDRVARDAGLVAVHLDLDTEVSAELLDEIERAFHPRNDEGQVGVAS